MLGRPLLLAFGAGLVSATGFAPLDWWPATLAGLAVLLWLVHRAPRLRDALLTGWLWGVGHFVVGNNWIQHAFTYQDKMPQWLGYLAVVLVALYLALYPALAMGLAWRFGEATGAIAGGRRCRSCSPPPPPGSSASGCAPCCSPAIPGTRSA